MPVKKYIIELTKEERNELTQLVRKGRVAASKRLHASILLKADIFADGPGQSDKQIAEALDVSVRTIERVRQQCVEEGLEATLQRKPRKRSRTKVIDGEAEAYLIATACSKPPEGRARWTLRLLANKMVELKYVDSVSYETVRQTLKKTH